VAPGADLAALRVFGNDSQGSFENVARALQWVIDNHDKDHITAVNLSLADPNNYAQNWFAQDRGVGQKITGLIGQLDALNIPVVAATGNSFNGQQGVGFPAIIPDTISVTSTDATGSQLTGDAQRVGPDIGGASATDIAAPGEGVVAPISGNQIGTMDGTSFAAPQVTGAVVLLQQIYESRFGRLPTVAQLDSWLEQGSSPVNDPVTKLSIGRLNISRAASLIPNPQLQVLTPPQPDSNWTTGSVSTSSTGLANDASSNIVAADQQQHQQPSDSSSQDERHERPEAGLQPRRQLGLGHLRGRQIVERLGARSGRGCAGSQGPDLDPVGHTEGPGQYPADRADQVGRPGDQPGRSRLGTDRVIPAPGICAGSAPPLESAGGLFPPPGPGGLEGTGPVRFAPHRSGEAAGPPCVTRGG
jgi:hypothetical protein